MPRMRSRTLLLLASLVALAAVACSRSADTTSSSTAVSSSAATSTSTTASMPKAALQKLTVDEVAARIAARGGKTFVYDNNPKERYEEGHLPGARWVESGEVTAAVLPADKSATLIFYCASEA
jgi:ABC-type glycerol-3-phosphate transport system substrate-binding protein